MRDKVIFTDVVCSGLALCRRREPWHITCLPHARPTKETACGCAGIFNAPYAIESYALVFEQEKALERLEGFASEFGARFYGLPLNSDKITLVRDPQPVPKLLDFPGATGDGAGLVPFHAGETLPWRLLP